MDEATLRRIVREAVARHLQQGAPPARQAPVPSDTARHPSHGRFALAPSPDGACIVEPAVRCTHCGFCQSMGH
jgi:hypothetical protein